MACIVWQWFSCLPNEPDTSGQSSTATDSSGMFFEGVNFINGVEERLAA